MIICILLPDARVAAATTMRNAHTPRDTPHHNCMWFGRAYVCCPTHHQGYSFLRRDGTDDHRRSIGKFALTLSGTTVR